MCCLCWIPKSKTVTDIKAKERPKCVKNRMIMCITISISRGSKATKCRMVASYLREVGDRWRNQNRHKETSKK